MSRAFMAFSLATAACAFAQMPIPARITPAAGVLKIDSAFSVSANLSDERLQKATHRLEARVFRQTGIPRAPGPKLDRATLVVDCRAAGPQYPSLDDNESYQLDVLRDGAKITAHAVAGALHGLATFAQLVVPGPGGFQVAAVHIEDHPRFRWRGFMLDVSRHWMPIPLVERNLDAMEAVKLNVFHWHLSDDQGFRVESKVYPKLQQLGSDGYFYTQDEIRHVVAYARDRGIRVIPEFDVPAHTTSWFPGYPELASAPGPYHIGRTWGIYEPTMDPTREETYKFLDAFFAEMMPLFPDPHFHIGGDEVNDRQWKASSSIQAFMREHNLGSSHELQAYFNRRLHAILKKHGKLMIGWDEILQPDLGDDITIQSWRGQKSLADAARQGYRGLLSFGYYLDHLRPASYHYGIDPLDGAARDLTAEQSTRILGGEACMWDEYANAETVDSRIWPRAAVIAERLWSPRETKDVDSMYSRMEAVSRQLDFLGLQHRTNYVTMLDRLSGGRNAPALRVLADAVEGLGLGDRHRAREYTSMVPLNRLADAARPESEPVRALELAARNADYKLLRTAFTEWRDNESQFAPLARENVLLAELIPVSKGLSSVGIIGLQALEYVTSGKAAPAGWVAQEKKALDAIEKPTAEVRIAATRAVRILLERLKS